VVFCLRGRDTGADQVQFTAVEQLPLDFFASLQANGSRERQREINVESGLLALGSDGLNFERIIGLHGSKLAYRLSLVDALTADFPPPRASARRVDECLASVGL
jgi:hypothetical protein